MEFQIPLSREDLHRRSEGGNYTVSDVYTSRELVTKLEGKLTHVQ